MPAVSKAQKRFMQIAEHNPKFAAKAGIKPEVAHEFLHPDAKRAAKRYSKDKKDGKK